MHYRRMVRRWCMVRRRHALFRREGRELYTDVCTGKPQRAAEMRVVKIREVGGRNNFYTDVILL